MSDHLVSVDEFLNARKDCVSGGDVLLKANRAASSWNPEKRSMRFVMSSELEDRDRDIVLQAGLNIDRFNENPVGFFNHRSYGRPHGTWSDIEKILNGRPKRTEGTFTVAPEGVNPEADALALDMGAGLIKASSIGFLPKAVKKREIPEDKRDAGFYWPGYEVLEAELVECSVVTVPSNPAALAKMARQGQAMAREIIEEVLDNFAIDPVSKQLISRAEFEEAYKAATGGAKGVLINVTLKSPQDAQELAHALSEKLGSHDDPPPADEGAAPNDAGAGEAEPAQPAGITEPELTQPQARSFLRRVLDIAFGAENEAKLEAELREQRHKEAEEAVAKAAVREDLEKRFQTLTTRLTERGLA